MTKKAEPTDAELYMAEFERQRLSKAKDEMMKAKLESHGSKQQATYGQVKRKLEKLKPKA